MPDIIRSIVTPEVHAQTVVNPDGSNIGDSLPTQGNNPSLELGYNAAGQLIRIRKTINSVVYTQLITGTDITDDVVVKTKTLGAFS